MQCNMSSIWCKLTAAISIYIWSFKYLIEIFVFLFFLSTTPIVLQLQDPFGETCTVKITYGPECKQFHAFISRPGLFSFVLDMLMNFNFMWSLTMELLENVDNIFQVKKNAWKPKYKLINALFDM